MVAFFQCGFFRSLLLPYGEVLSLRCGAAARVLEPGRGSDGDASTPRDDRIDLSL